MKCLRNIQFVIMCSLLKIPISRYLKPKKKQIITCFHFYCLAVTCWQDTRWERWGIYRSIWIFIWEQQQQPRIHNRCRCWQHWPRCHPCWRSHAWYWCPSRERQSEEKEERTQVFSVRETFWESKCNQVEINKYQKWLQYKFFAQVFSFCNVFKNFCLAFIIEFDNEIFSKKLFRNFLKVIKDKNDIFNLFPFLKYRNKQI